MRWNETITLEFVKLYLKHECLWNPAQPGYKIKSQRDKAYAQISAEFKKSTMKIISIPEVKLKIKNLRTTYLQQVHKILKKSRPDFIYEPSLIWFQEMDRCMKHIPTNRHSILYHNAQEMSDVDSSCQIWVDPDLKNTTANIRDLVNDPLFAKLGNESKQQDSICVPGDKDCVHERMQSNESYPLKPVCTANSSCSTAASVTADDEFDVYGKYIATQLRKMELNKALRLQLEIQNLVSEARISELSKK